MTKKERFYIERQIEKFERWANEELSRVDSLLGNERKECYFQYELNSCAANTLRNLLNDLEEGV